MNGETSLDGGVADDGKWQMRWLKVISSDLKLWTAAWKHAAGKHFVNLLANEFRGVQLCQWNSERAVLFAPSILDCKKGVVKASEINRTISLRLDLWEAGQFVELVNEVMVEARSGIAGRRPEDWKDEEVAESVAKTYNSLFLTAKFMRPFVSQTNVAEEVATAEDERADATHSPYVAGDENLGDVAVDGFWRSGRQ